MAYKAPLLMRIFHYSLWAIMLLMVFWFLIIPIFLRVTAPRPTKPPERLPQTSSTTTPDLKSLGPIRQPDTIAVTP